MLFETQLSNQPYDMAITDLRNTRTWQELNSRVLKIAGYFRYVQKLQANDHVALVVGNRIEFMEAMFGGIVAGLWVTPVNTHLLPAEVQYIVEDSTAKCVLVDREHASLVCANDKSSGLPSFTLDNIESLFESLTEADISRCESYRPSPNDVAGGTMLYTSGTTGRPKGVKRAKPATLGEAISKMKSGGKLFGLSGTGPHLVTGPLYHAAPMLFALYDMLNGAPVVIMPKWDISVFLETVAGYRIVTTHLVPTMFVRLLNYRDALGDGAVLPKLSSLGLVLHGAAPIAVSTKQKMIEWWGPILVEYWGGSEAGTTTLVTSEEWMKFPGTVGKPLDHFQVYVGDAQGNPVDESVGALYCRHAFLEQVFSYHNDVEKTAKAHPQPYVFSIGDIGSVDEQGFVYLSDRESNMIISGGVNIYPAEVEQALIEHPDVADVAVFGIPNEEWGEEVRAVVQLKDGRDASELLARNIREFVQTKVAKFKVPRSVSFENSLPRTPTGKLLVRVLKEKYKNNS